MVALTILGLGLVMVATMFPVAWDRARKLSEVTTQTTVTNTTEQTLKLLVTVDGPNSRAGSFAGDLLVYDGQQIAVPDHRVHALFLENVLASTPGAFTPDRMEPAENVETAPWQLERVETSVPLPVLEDTYPEFFKNGFGGPQVRFEQRVYPPLRPRDVTTVDNHGEFTEDDPQWDDALGTRRYAWAVLHRLRAAESDPNNPELPIVDTEAPREFDIYHVTLKRARPTYRFAQQDSDQLKIPDPFDRKKTYVPAALPPDHDVVLPVPWRVQVYFPDTLAPKSDPTGVPTEIQVNTSKVPTGPFVVDFFRQGTPFIDERNGKVYRVVRRRFAGDDEDHAFLTLDQEVLLEDIDDGYYSGDPPDNHFENDILDATHESEELIRTVWVFPPPVEAGRLSNRTPVFVGKQPVLSIEVRRLTVEPDLP